MVLMLCFQDSSGEAHGPTFKIEARFRGLTATAEGNSQNLFTMIERRMSQNLARPGFLSLIWRYLGVYLTKVDFLPKFPTFIESNFL